MPIASRQPWKKQCRISLCLNFACSSSVQLNIVPPGTEGGRGHISINFCTGRGSFCDKAVAGQVAVQKRCCRDPGKAVRDHPVGGRRGEPGGCGGAERSRVGRFRRASPGGGSPQTLAVPSPAARASGAAAAPSPVRGGPGPCSAAPRGERQPEAEPGVPQAAEGGCPVPAGKGLPGPGAGRCAPAVPLTWGRGRGQQGGQRRGQEAHGPRGAGSRPFPLCRAASLLSSPASRLLPARSSLLPLPFISSPFSSFFSSFFLPSLLLCSSHRSAPRSTLLLFFSPSFPFFSPHRPRSSAGALRLDRAAPSGVSVIPLPKGHGTVRMVSGKVPSLSTESLFCERVRDSGS